MERHRPPIAPLPEDGERPLWSVMIPTFECADTLRETLGSVLAQDPGEAQMQIEVVDDASSGDDPGAVAAELGGGRVGFFRQPRNLGHVGNFNTCIERARGRLVHILHGDDAVREGFYRTMQEPFLARPEIGAAFCRYIAVDGGGSWVTLGELERDGRGILRDWLPRIALGQRLQPPAMVVRRTTYEALGGFDTRIRTYGEDWEMWVRIAASFPVWYEPEPLALYRIHDTSLTPEASRSGRNVRDVRAVIELNRALLPPELAATTTAKALEIAATTALRRAERMLHAGDSAGAAAQAREALRTCRSAAVLERAAVLGLLWIRHLVKRRGRA